MSRLVPGDIVVGYHKGYWIVDSIRNEMVNYTRVDKKATRRCHIDYCRKIDINENFESMVKHAHEIRDMLHRAKEKYNENR